jgi:hypothetical protein
MHSENGGDRPGSDALQDAFDTQAGSLGLEFDPPNVYGRDIGAFVRRRRAVVEPGVPHTLTPPGNEDDQILAAVIHGWELLDPDQAGLYWKQFATDPFVAVGRGAIGIMDDEAYRLWRDSDELRKDLEAFPPFSPRRIRILNLRTSYVGFTTATATYTVEEDYQNARTRFTNASLILLKIDPGTWKIAAETVPERSIR